ncbi:hypothetical protein HPB50_001487 [Hyalomma asiaticum]|uniref:Uncharacterized protein n=1 Tax=Hyalomma asiaticum TaxID=266040 RepID=A0ACB7RTQ2_HYAAI|nr:hypothetical protein HPB50_001487 [Hyalomma asiaticum]
MLSLPSLEMSTHGTMRAGQPLVPGQYQSVGLETFVDAAQYGRFGKFAVTVVSEKADLLSAEGALLCVGLVVLLAFDSGCDVLQWLSCDVISKRLVHRTAGDRDRMFSQQRASVSVSAEKVRRNLVSTRECAWAPGHKSKLRNQAPVSQRLIAADDPVLGTESILGFIATGAPAFFPPGERDERAVAVAPSISELGRPFSTPAY